MTGAKWTFGDLCHNPAVQEQWKMYSHPDNAFPVEEGVVGGFVLFVRLSCYSIINTSSFSLFCHYICFVRGPWRRQISRALEWLHSPDIRHRTVTVVCEVS